MPLGWVQTNSSVREHLIIFQRFLFFQEVCSLGAFQKGFVVFVYACSYEYLGIALSEGLEYVFISIALIVKVIGIMQFIGWVYTILYIY